MSKYKIILPVIVILIFAMSACNLKTEEGSVFEQLSPNTSGIDFMNVVAESDTFNMYTFMNIYTGGGVAIGDINNEDWKIFSLAAIWFPVNCI